MRSGGRSRGEGGAGRQADARAQRVTEHLRREHAFQPDAEADVLRRWGLQPGPDVDLEREQREGGRRGRRGGRGGRGADGGGSGGGDLGGGDGIRARGVSGSKKRILDLGGMQKYSLSRMATAELEAFEIGRVAIGVGGGYDAVAHPARRRKRGPGR